MSIITIERMVAWVEKNLKEKPSLDKMSEFVGYSPFYCSAKFREHMGISFKEYVNKRKLTMAALELRNTNHKVLEIAINYGFSSHEAFTRSFMKMFGCTPGQYRKIKL